MSEVVTREAVTFMERLRERASRRPNAEFSDQWFQLIEEYAREGRNIPIDSDVLDFAILRRYYRRLSRYFYGYSLSLPSSAELEHAPWNAENPYIAMSLALPISASGEAPLPLGPALNAADAAFQILKATIDQPGVVFEQCAPGSAHFKFSLATQFTLGVATAVAGTFLVNLFGLNDSGVAHGSAFLEECAQIMRNEPSVKVRVYNSETELICEIFHADEIDVRGIIDLEANHYWFQKTKDGRFIIATKGLD